jgi:hypothetical protein
MHNPSQKVHFATFILLRQLRNVWLCFWVLPQLVLSPSMELCQYMTSIQLHCIMSALTNMHFIVAFMYKVG